MYPKLTLLHFPTRVQTKVILENIIHVQKCFKFDGICNCIEIETIKYLRIYFKEHMKWNRH